MDRINGADTFDIGGGKRGFRGEDLTAGIAGTEITALWLNAIQEEIAAVIEDAGIVLSAADNGQLLAALERRAAARGQPWIPVISLLVTAPPGAPAFGDSYIIPANGTGAWAGKSQQLAQWDGRIWRYTVTRNGHGVGMVDGTVWLKVAGIYVLLPLAAFATVEETIEGESEILKTHPKGVMAAIRKAIAGIGSAPNGNTNANVGEELWVDTSAGAVTVSLPANPPEGGRIFIGRRGGNALDVARNGKTIEGVADDFRINRDRRGCFFVYVGGTWRLRGEILAK